MKVKGILIILLFLVLIPVTIDALISGMVKGNSFGMSKKLFSGYLGYLPLYIVWVAAVFLVMNVIKNWKKNSNKE